VSVETHSAPEAVHEEIMAATYRVVCTTGYADLTMREIAAEAGKSKSLLHYHYETKEGLLVAFLDHMLTRFEREVDAMDGESPAERLGTLIRRLTPDSPAADEGDDAGGGDADPGHRFHRALLELRAQAPCRAAYREQLRRNKAAIESRLVVAIREGIESGEFREVDPKRAARFVLAALDGARTSAVALGDDADAVAVRESVAEYLLADDEARSAFLAAATARE
jgi:AcrR family transcriptional regulator